MKMIKRNNHLKDLNIQEMEKNYIYLGLVYVN